MRQWRLVNADKSRFNNQKSRKKNWHKWKKKANRTRRVGYRKSYLARQYGITQEQYNQFLIAQGGRCAICQTKFVKIGHIDHDHKTGKVRGLLCFKCNVGIGHLDDDPLKVKAALDYLL